MSVAGDLEPIELLTAEGTPQRLGELWRHETAVLVFIRHFGCQFGREQVARLRDDREAIEDEGARIVVIGNGLPQGARAFRDELRLAFPLLVDPELKAYTAAGLDRGMAVGGERKDFSGRRRAYTHPGGVPLKDAAEGDPWQLGGAFVITPAGEVVLSHVSTGPEDNVEPADIISALSQTVIDQRDPQD